MADLLIELLHGEDYRDMFKPDQYREIYRLVNKINELGGIDDEIAEDTYKGISRRLMFDDTYKDRERYGALRKIVRIMKKSKPKTLIVFDFDCTLTTKHFYYFMNDLESFNNNPLWESIELKNNYEVLRHNIENGDLSLPDKELLINEFFGGNERLQSLISMIETLKSDGCTVRIASRGYKSQIIAFMKNLGLSHLFADDHITGIEKDKSQLLNEYIQQLVYDHIFYIDDDSKEHNGLLNFYEMGENQDKTQLFNKWVISEISYYFFTKLVKNENGLTKNNLYEITRFIIYHNDPDVYEGKKRHGKKRHGKKQHSKKRNNKCESSTKKQKRSKK